MLLPSQKVESVPRNLLRETLFDEGFIISGFKHKSSASEKEFTSSFEKVLSDKMAVIPGSPKFNFARAVERKILEIRTAEEITGELLKHFCGPRFLMICHSYLAHQNCLLTLTIRMITSISISNLFNEPIIGFNNKDEPLEGPKNHTDPTKCDTNQTIIQMMKLGP